MLKDGEKERTIELSKCEVTTSFGKVEITTPDGSHTMTIDLPDFDPNTQGITDILPEVLIFKRSDKDPTRIDILAGEKEDPWKF